MATTDYTSFKKYVAPDLLPCPGPIVERAITDTIIEFCDKTHILTKEFNVEIDTDEIDSDLHNSLDIELTEFFSNVAPGIVFGFNIDGSIYRPERREILTTVPTSIWQMDANPDYVLYFSFPTYKILRVYDAKTTWDNLYVAMSVKPNRDSTKVDSQIYEDHLEAITAGVKYRILGMPGKEWTNKSSSADNYIMWRRKLSETKARVLRKYSNWPMEVSPRSFHRIDWGV